MKKRNFTRILTRMERDFIMIRVEVYFDFVNGLFGQCIFRSLPFASYFIPGGATFGPFITPDG